MSGVKGMHDVVTIIDHNELCRCVLRHAENNNKKSAILIAHLLKMVFMEYGFIHFRRVRVQLYARIQARKCYIKSLLSVLKDKRSCFSK